MNLSDPQTIAAVWNKGRNIPDFSSQVWRWDVYGNPIKWSEYGNRASKYGWEIDHILPISQGGTDDLSNLRPLQWEANTKRPD